jgi:hypothetical protein
MKKVVTLPIGNKDIFTELAKIAWSVEDDKSQDRDAFFEEVLQQLGADAFLYSFTPSGEIGCGDNEFKSNPTSARFSADFYDAIETLVGPEGSVTKVLNAKISSKPKGRERMLRFRSAVVNLATLYAEAVLNMKSRDKDSRSQKVARRTKKAKGEEVTYDKRERVTDFNFKKRGTETDEEWRRYLVQVMENRYIRFFVATVFFKTISDLFTIRSEDIYKTMKAGDLLGISEMNDKTKFKVLSQPETMKEFTDKILKMWTLELREPLPKKVTKPKKKIKEGEQAEESDEVQGELL